RQTGSRIFCSSDTTALHFETRGVARVTLQDVEFEDHPCWTIRTHRADGGLLFLVTAAARECLPTWNKLLLAHTA
ncbi:MAG TPA: hypothetical protein VIT21_07870, partial [Chthoniobacterales bacterium]